MNKSLFIYKLEASYLYVSIRNKTIAQLGLKMSNLYLGAGFCSNIILVYIILA